MDPTTVVDTIYGFLKSIVAFGLLEFLALRLPPTPIESARFRVDLKPWDRPLGVFQFVFLTFIFVGVGGVALSYFLASGRINLAISVLAMSGEWVDWRLDCSIRLPCEVSCLTGA